MGGKVLQNNSTLPYEIEKEGLVPFKYYSIYDETVDYNHIAMKSGRFDEKDC